ncbi:MAG: tRNA epoxyqueuosine(34) reductase QueG [Verrucomicrobia bacterium]|nr:tRNA epoxyqueuosine(34) reductase QueG [Verrucomicrobiota bacterium]
MNLARPRPEPVAQASSRPLPHFDAHGHDHQADVASAGVAQIHPPGPPGDVTAPARLAAAVKAQARALGFDACGITDASPPGSGPHLASWLDVGHHGEMAYLARHAARRIDPREVLPGLRSVVCLAVSYHGDCDQPSPPPALYGVVARYARFTDYHDVLAARLRDLTAFLNGLGGAEARSLWYVDTGPVLERDLAQRAGLGFIGKHTNLLGRTLGNWFLLAEILTTVALAPDAPERNRCGTCSRCLDACPTRAFVAPFVLDARRCISYLTIEHKGSIPLELRPALGTRIFGCDDCLAACPWNRFARAGRLMREHTRADLAAPDLIELLRLDAAAFKVRFAGTPMARAKRRGLLRNVSVALGNLGDPAALPALRQAEVDPDPLIAEHARWAIERIEAP